MTARGAWLAALMSVSVLALSSCRSPERAPVVLPPKPHVVDVAMAEHRFDYDPKIPAGRVVFRVRNTGRVVHSLSLIPLGDDIPPIDEQLRGSRRIAIPPFAEIGPRRPGGRTTFAVDLKPGARYALVCFVRDGEGSSHALLGMTSEFRTPGPPPPDDGKPPPVGASSVPPVSSTPDSTVERP